MGSGLDRVWPLADAPLHLLPPPPPRRQVARDEKLSTQHREHEARMARALERAAAPVFKKTGKPLMFRSAPPQRKKVVQADDRNDEEAELEAYLAQDMI